MVRPGKFKRRRDGGRTINHHLVLDNDGVAVDKRRPRPAQDGEEEEEDEDEEEEDDEDEDEDEGDDVPGGSELSRVERKGLKKKQASEKAKTLQADGEKPNEDEDEDDLITNPNRATKKLTISDLSGPRELTRKEREQKEKQEAKDRYWKLHVQGKTDQARADLSRLAKIRADREAAAAKRKAEAEEKAKALEVAKDAQKSSKR